MAFSNYAAYKAARDAPVQRIQIARTNSTTRMSRIYSLWTNAGTPGPGANPTTSAVPVNDTAGGLLQEDTSGTARILRVMVTAATALRGMLTIADRLNHSGGCSATTTTAQTTNLPTAALTRKTSGVGVLAAVELYGTCGATASTFSCSYTNTTPTAGRTSPETTIGTSDDYRELGRMLLMPLQSGDKGVTSVESVDLTASTGTAGDFGITMFYPLIHVPFDNAGTFDHEAMFGLGTFFPKVDTNACLFLMGHVPATSWGVVMGQVDIGEE